jgi:signal transduction histidine kinase/ActR/RegA family two-component response regulator
MNTQEAKALDQTTLQALIDALPDYALLLDQEHNFVAMNHALASALDIDTGRLRTEHGFAVKGTSDGFFASFPLHEIVNTDCASEKQLHDANSDAWALVSTYPISVGAATDQALCLCVIKDITHEKRVRVELSRSLEQQNGLNSILHAVQAAQTPAEVLEVAIDAVLQVSWLGVRTSAAGFLSEGQHLRKVVDRNLPLAVEQGCARVSLGECLCGRVGKTGESIVCAHLDERHVHYEGILDHGHVILPLKWQAQILGVLCFYLAAGQELDEHHRAFLEAAASIVATAMGRLHYQSQLLQAQKTQVVGQLTGGIAHDFNNLLTVILTNLGILADEIVGEAEANVRELIGDALSAARDGAELIHRLLAFSRKQPLQVKQVDINEFFPNIKRFLQRTLTENVELRINLANELPPVLVDPSQLENALLNLVINARDAMPGGGTLTIETTRECVALDEVAPVPELTPGNYVMIAVRDSGVGMSTDVMGHAIEPFFTTKERGKGSGLGLSMVYGFAKQSGGGLLLRSAPGEGTTVSMLLPQAAPTTENDDAELTQPNAPRGSERILLVEDEPRVRKLVKHSLLGLGYRVIEAENAAEAMKAFEAGIRVDLLFSDIVMPGTMNGRELARQVLHRRSGPRVLLTTGFSEEETGKLAADDAGFRVLRKPYTKKELAAAVRAVLDAESSAQP